MTFSYLNWLQNSELLNLEVQRKVPRKGAFYYINYHNSGTFFDLQISQLAILKPVEVGKSYIPQKKALYPAV